MQGGQLYAGAGNARVAWQHTRGTTMRERFSGWYMARVHYVLQDDAKLEARAFESKEARAGLWVRAAESKVRAEGGRTFLANPAPLANRAGVAAELCRSGEEAKVEDQSHVASLGKPMVYTTELVYLTEEQLVAVKHNGAVKPNFAEVQSALRRLLLRARGQVAGAECYDIKLEPLTKPLGFRYFVEKAQGLTVVEIRMAGRNMDDEEFEELLKDTRDLIPGAGNCNVQYAGQLRLDPKVIDALEYLATKGFATVRARARRPLPDGTRRYDSAAPERLRVVELEGEATSEEVAEEVAGAFAEVRRERRDDTETEEG